MCRLHNRSKERSTLSPSGWWSAFQYRTFWVAGSRFIRRRRLATESARYAPSVRSLAPRPARHIGQLGRATQNVARDDLRPKPEGQGGRNVPGRRFIDALNLRPDYRE